MASIKNQPSPKPSSLPPTPDEVDISQFEPPSDVDLSGFAPPSEADMGGMAFEAPPTFGETPAGQAVGKVAEYLPEIGGFVGGIAGGVSGAAAGGVGAIPGGIAGAAAGGAAGAAFRDIIELQILGRAPKPVGEVVSDIGKGGVVEGASQAIGGVVAKGLGKLGSAAVKYGDDLIGAMKNATSVARNKLEQPVTEMLLKKGTQLTPMESGDAVKTLLTENIKGKYGPFIAAYQQLDEVGSALPLKDETRRSLTMKLREWSASELGGDNARVVRKFVDDLDAADNGAKLRSVISQIGDAKSTAFRNGATGQAQVLARLQEQANDFLEGQTTKLAQRVMQGKAAPEEIAFIQKIAQSRGIQEPDPTKYAKSLAKDYLASMGKVKNDYAAFRSFLEDVSEQTRVSVKGKNKGPLNFMNAIDDVPSEKLIEKMFDPKNARALQAMQKETPEIYDQVVKARVSDIMRKSSPTGELDLIALRDTVNKLPPDTKRLLFSPEELKNINKVASDPKLAQLLKKEKKWEERTRGYLMDVAKTVSEKTPAGVKAAGRQAIGKTTMTVGDMFLPEPEPMQSFPRTVNGLGE